MPLSWNEIRSRAHEFSRHWAGETSERAEAQSFWNEFFAIFGIERKRVASFEKQVKLSRAGEKLKHGRIDAFWKGTLLIEHKSAGQDLDRAFAQGIDYFDGLAERDLPRYILVSDFARFRLHDLEAGSEVEFKLADLHKHIKHFAFVAGYRTQEIAPQNPVNIKAAERMGALHDLLKASGYAGHALEVLLVRLLFCLFAEDTGIFQPASAFRLWLEERTDADGADLGPQLALLFQVLNTPEVSRGSTLDEQLAAFPIFEFVSEGKRTFEGIKVKNGFLPFLSFHSLGFLRSDFATRGNNQYNEMQAIAIGHQDVVFSCDNPVNPIFDQVHTLRNEVGNGFDDIFRTIDPKR